MSFIRTVCGDIPTEKLGVCYAHEHIIIDQSYTTYGTPDFLLDSVENAIAELKQFYQDGGRSMVDSMPCDSGRNILKLAEISKKSGVHIIGPTGVHLEKYYDPGHWSRFYDEDILTRLFTEDIEKGIDANDYNGPILARTQHRAGVIKIASGLNGISAHEAKVFRAASQAHCATGCPILTHTEQGTTALEQISLLQTAGVNLKHVCISHCDRKPDESYHREILSTGVKLEYDSAFRWKGDQENFTLSLLIKLLPDFPDQIMLGMDAARRGYWRSYGGKPGLSYLLTNFSEQLRVAGINESVLKKIFIGTPAETFSFS